jgi:hypothetical protein
MVGQSAEGDAEVKMSPFFHYNSNFDAQEVMKAIGTPTSPNGLQLCVVDLAGETFTVIELGCGWGCWLNNTGAAARRSSRKPYLIGIEGDRGHIGFAREAYVANGFSDSQVTLYHGIAAAKGGVALFPRQKVPGVQWGLQPILNPGAVKRAAAKLSGMYEELPIISLAEASQNHRRIDLLHIDIQGGEADLIHDCVPVLNEKWPTF